MSKSIGIYGDSFGFFVPNYSQGPSWAERLQEKYNVAVHAAPGKSVFTCYQEYFMHNEKYDINIFICPQFGRLHSSYLIKLFQDLEGFRSQPHSWYYNLDSVTFVKYLLSQYREKNPSSAKLIASKLEIIQSFEVYFRYWQDDVYTRVANSALAKEIKSQPNVIYLDADSALVELCIWELEQVGYKSKYLDNGYYLGYTDHEKKRILMDIRKNHFSEENNLILYQKIDNFIESNKFGEIEIDSKDFVIPPGPIEKYLRWQEYE